MNKIMIFILSLLLGFTNQLLPYTFTVNNRTNSKLLVYHKAKYGKRKIQIVPANTEGVVVKSERGNCWNFIKLYILSPEYYANEKLYDISDAHQKKLYAQERFKRAQEGARIAQTGAGRGYDEWLTKILDIHNPAPGGVECFNYSRNIAQDADGRIRAY